MRVHTFTLQNPIVFEIDSTKNMELGGKNVDGKNYEKIAKADVYKRQILILKYYTTYPKVENLTHQNNMKYTNNTQHNQTTHLTTN